MNVLDLIVWVFNQLTDNSFTLMTLSELSTFSSGLTYWAQLFNPSFIMSFVIWISVFYFTWKVTYQLFFRLFMLVVQFPKKWKNK